MPPPETDPLRVVRSEQVTPRGERYDLALQVRRPGPRALRGGADGLAVRWASAGRAVQIDVLGAGEATAEDIDGALAAGIGLAGLEDDPLDFPAIARRHPLVAELQDRYAGARLVRVPSVWEALAVAILEQLVTSQEASAAIRAVWWRWGEAIPGTTLRAPPRASVIARVAAWELRERGVGSRRATTLIGAARRARALEGLVHVDPDEAMRRMRTLPGIGVWTANKVAMAALGHADACLIGDAGAPFVTTMALTGIPGGDDAMVACLEPFRPHRARVHRLLDLAQSRGGGVPGVPPRMRPRVDLHRRFPRWQ